MWQCSVPALAFEPLPRDPPPDTGPRREVRRFLADHGVEVALVEYLDFADRWFDLLCDLGLRVWLRGHGVDLSARLRDPQWRAIYQGYRAADGIIVPSQVAARAVGDLGLPDCLIHVVPYGVDVPTLIPLRSCAGADLARCLAVGRMVPKKAPELLLEAFRLV